MSGMECVCGTWLTGNELMEGYCWICKRSTSANTETDDPYDTGSDPTRGDT